MGALRVHALTTLILVALVTLPIIFYKKRIMTKDQQDNIVRKIVRGYNVTVVEFKSVTMIRSSKTYQLRVKLNKNDTYTATIPMGDITWLNDDTGYIELNPTDACIDIKKDRILEDEPVDISHVYIKYLK